MTVSYTWSVRPEVSPDLAGLTDVVVAFEVRITAADEDGHCADWYAHVVMGDPDPDNFQPFPDAGSSAATTDAFRAMLISEACAQLALTTGEMEARALAQLELRLAAPIAKQLP